MICRTGTGRTAPSRLVVRKSQKILGQKKPSKAAATWSVVARGRLVWFFSGFGGKLVVDQCGNGRGRWLTGCGSEDDQSSPVVFDELAHDCRGKNPSLAKTPNPAKRKEFEAV